MFAWLMLVDLAEAKKKPKVPPAPPVGWAQEEGWSGPCYFPPDFTAMGDGDRRMARQKALEEMKLQWTGGKGEDIRFNEGVIDDVETTLLGRPAQIEAVAATNLEMCRKVRTGQASTGDWESWLGGLSVQLTAGECLRPLTYTLFDYLDIGRGWQRPVHICQGDRAQISGTTSDRYRISEKGDWITVEGIPGQKAPSSEYPCDLEGCWVGMLVGRFTTDAGVVTVFPIGSSTVFTAPEHGTLEYAINDVTWYDNKWFKSATVEDRAAITIEPAP